MSKNECKIDVDVNNGQTIGAAQTVNIIYQDPDYGKLVPLMEEIVHSELEKYTDHAKTIAFERHEEMTQMLLTKVFTLEHSLEELEKSFSTPAMQFDFYEADKAYIKSGDKDKLEVLSSIISERIRSVDETLKQIAISESIKVVPLLNQKLMDALAFTFLLGYTFRKDIRTLTDLKTYLRKCVLPFCKSACQVSDLDFQHLDYTRCSIQSVASRRISGILLDNYSSAFYLPINKVEIDGAKCNGKSLAEWFPGLLACHGGEYSFSVFNKKQCNDVVERNPFGATESIKQSAKDFFRRHLPEEKDVKEIVVNKDSGLNSIFDAWDKGCANLFLSSVGMAIAIIHINNKLNMGLNLDVWLS